MYQMLVVIFGAKSSPAIANYVLRRALIDYEAETETRAILSAEEKARSFYMDDCLLSALTESTAKQLLTEVSEALSEGGFHLTKWRSNSPAVLLKIPESDRASVSSSLCLTGSPTAEKALGIVWDETKDTLGFRLRRQELTATKRAVLCKVSSVFDPLGIAAPFTIRAKVMMQRLWCLHLEWDDDLPELQSSEWSKWLEESENSMRSLFSAV